MNFSGQFLAVVAPRTGQGVLEKNLKKKKYIYIYIYIFKLN